MARGRTATSSRSVAGYTENLDPEAAAPAGLVAAAGAPSAGKPGDDLVRARCCEDALAIRFGQVGVDGEFSAQDAVALRVSITDAVPVLLERPLVVAVQHIGDLLDQLIFVVSWLLQMVAVGDEAGRVGGMYAVGHVELGSFHTRIHGANGLSTPRRAGLSDGKWRTST